MKLSSLRFTFYYRISLLLIAVSIIVFTLSMAYELRSRESGFSQADLNRPIEVWNSILSDSATTGGKSLDSLCISEWKALLDIYNERTKAPSSAVILGDSIYFSTGTSSCLKQEFFDAKAHPDRIRSLRCREQNNLQHPYWVKTYLSDQVEILSIQESPPSKNQYLLLIGISFFFLLSFIFILPILYKKKFHKQLSDITKVVTQISDKDFETYIKYDYSGILGNLTKAISKMQAQLKENLQDLEIRVIRRTSEISLRNAELRKTHREILKQNSELKSAYEALKESRAKYEQLIEHLEDEYFFYSKAINGTLLFVSPSVKKILGYEVREYREIHDHIYTDNPLNGDARKHQELVCRGVAQPKYRLEVSAKNKEERMLEISEVAIYSEEGKLVSVEGLAHDITEQQKAEALIKEQEEKYRMLFTHASDFILMYEVNTQEKKIGKFIEANNYALERLEYTIEELREKTPLDLQAVAIWHEEETEIYELAIIDTTFDRIWESKKGLILDVEISAHAFKMRNKEVAIIVARDITERKKADEEIRFVNEELINQKENLEALVDNLTQTQEQLVQSEKMAALGQLIAGIAHEINTPLGAIKASIGNLGDSLETALNELPSLFQSQSIEDLRLFTEIFELARIKKPELTSREKRQARREITAKLKEHDITNPELLADTLVYLEIYSDSLPELLPSLEKKDSLQVVRSARNFISLLKNTNTINLAVEKATKVVFALKKYAHKDTMGEKSLTDIIDSIETVLTLYNNQLKQGVEIKKEYETLPLVQCYRDEISQVWTNLIQNAIQAVRHDGNLTIKTHHQNDHVFVSFEDDGPGIEPDIKDRIFEPFFTTKKQGEGSGLGLDIVKKIIEKHNGIISVESTLGEGAKFIIKLPVE